MPLNTIDRLKQAYTDQYVIVTGGRPELARFEGAVGQVKTVNMSGRALVEFTGYHNNPAWHDIDTSWLKIVDRPPDPEPPAKKVAKTKASQPASKVPTRAAKPKSAADILAAARGGQPKPSAKPDAAGRTAKKTSPSASKSTADILAAARGKKSSAVKADGEKKPGSEKKRSPAVALSTSDVLAAARGESPAPAEPEEDRVAKKPTSGLSTAEILAAARGKKAADVDEKPTSAPANAAAEEATTQPAPRKKLSAADILAIANKKLSARREQPIATQPRSVEKVEPALAEEARPEALPAPVNRRTLTAADIRDLGKRK